jgi:hypothetical protein
MLSKWDIASSIVSYQSGSSAQRIRIGLTGLAAAFIIILFASVIARSSHDDTVNAAKTAVNETSEPLAEMGVAPGASDGANKVGNKQ